MKDFRNFYKDKKDEIFASISVKHKVTVEDLETVIALALNNGEKVTKKLVFDRVCSHYQQFGAEPGDNALHGHVDIDEDIKIKAQALAQALFPKFFNEHYSD